MKAEVNDPLAFAQVQARLPRRTDWCSIRPTRLTLPELELTLCAGWYVSSYLGIIV